jgi:hypothetical protein
MPNFSYLDYFSKEDPNDGENELGSITLFPPSLVVIAFLDKYLALIRSVRWKD